MPKAILAMRTYPATLLVALFLFLATLLITTGSLGKVIGGGDGGDGGSGMGGTGKSGEFGGSGFGGTGGPSPFFTSTDDQQEQKKTPRFAIPALVESHSIELAHESQSDVAPQVVSPAVLDAIENNPMVEETRIALTQDAEHPASEPVDAEATTRPLQLVELQQAIDSPAQDTLQRPEAPFTEAQERENTESETQLAAGTKSDEGLKVEANRGNTDTQVAETIAVKMETEQQLSEQTRDRNGIPERIQRPDLPPFQRIRPVERPALMPPRVQPMRI